MSWLPLGIITYGTTCGDKIVEGSRGPERWVLDKKQFEWTIMEWSETAQCYIDSGRRVKAE